MERTSEDIKFMEGVSAYIIDVWNKEREIAPCVFMYSAGKTMMIPAETYFENSTTKRTLAAMIQVSVDALKLERCALVSEVWMAWKEVQDKNDKAELERILKGPSASQLPNRKECIMINMWTKDLSILKLWRIDRSNNTITLEEDIEQPAIDEPVDVTFRNPYANSMLKNRK